MSNVLLNVGVDTLEGTLQIKVVKGELDGAVVIEIDTPDWEDGSDAPDMGPRLRLQLNDALLHHGVEIPNHELTT